MKVIKDGSKEISVKHTPLKAFDWADLSERLLALLLADTSKGGAEASMLAKAFAGYAPAGISKDKNIADALPSVIGSVSKSLAVLSKSDKKDLYNELFKTLTIVSDTGAEVPVTTDILDEVLEKPASFYQFVGYAIQEHFAFLSDTTVEKTRKTKT